MGCLRAEKIIDYLCDPLQKCLRDDNPYVRKTAALCVAKLYDLKPELAIDNGFVEQLQDMVSDSNPMVSFTVEFMNDGTYQLSRSLQTLFWLSLTYTMPPPPFHLHLPPIEQFLSSILTSSVNFSLP
jgi:non-SMC mitotic condensation complex subunit 1